jgi:hypothetical protein
MRRYCDHCGMTVEFKVLKGEDYAELRENSHAELWENSHAELWENSHAELWENSHAELWENSHAELWGNSHAELWENSYAELWENSYAELWGNSHAQCRSPYACGILKSITSKCIGRHIGDKPLSPKEYLTNCGVEIKNQYVLLYKTVQDNFCSHYTNSVKYLIGQEVVAPDWKPDDKIECGNGLHLSPTIQQAMTFNQSGVYLACRVKLSDIASLPAYAQYPDKIRVRACTPLYQVDKEGNKLPVNQEGKA